MQIPLALSSLEVELQIAQAIYTLSGQLLWKGLFTGG